MHPLDAGPAVSELKFRDPATARALAGTLASLVAAIDRAPVSVMHVCGSHEQAIAKFGLRASFPKGLDVIMGPGCPVCVTDVPEVDEARRTTAEVVFFASGFETTAVATAAEILRGLPENLSILSVHKYIPPV